MCFYSISEEGFLVPQKNTKSYILFRIMHGALHERHTRKGRQENVLRAGENLRKTQFGTTNIVLIIV